MLRFGPYELRPTTRELYRNGSRLKLPPQAFEVLRVLVERRGELVGRQEFHRILWTTDTFVDFDQGLNNAIKRIREVLNDSSEAPKYVETLPRLGYRFIGEIDTVSTIQSTAESSPVALTEEGSPPSDANTFAVSGPEQELASATTAARVEKRRSSFTRFRWVAAGIAGVVILGVAVGGRLLSRRPTLTPRSTIVIADFSNTTGDPVFDGTLRQGLSVQLEQSPSFRILPDEQIQQTLQRMGRKPDARMTSGVAKELCIRSGAGVVVDGSIAQIGTEYLLTLNAANCATGESLAGTEAEARSKSDVLGALGKASREMRGKLGESLASIRKFDTSLAEATTSSLEALEIYSNVVQGHANGDPFVLLQHAVELDPKFAVAYVTLASGYSNRGEAELASQFAQKAYDNREHATERDRFRIDAGYDYATLGDLEQELRVYTVWEQIYPRDSDPWNDSAATKSVMGDYEGALTESETALRLGPNKVIPYVNASSVLLDLNRLDEAKLMAQRALDQGHDVADAHVLLYRAAFLRNDTKEMQAQLASLREGGPSEGYGFCLQSNTDAYFGRVKSSREYAAKELRFARERHLDEISALIKDSDGLREVEYGFPARAREDAELALTLSQGRHARLQAALVLARAGEFKRAQEIADDLKRKHSADTVLQTYWLTTIRGAIELARRNPSKALEALQHVPYEFGDTGTYVSSTGNLYPVFLRGQAYLEKQRGKEAEAEFQNLLGHRTIAFNSPLAALAHLGLARAYVMQRETARAHAAYQDFLALWKDADPDIPVLKEARAEYAKLH